MSTWGLRKGLVLGIAFLVCGKVFGFGVVLPGYFYQIESGGLVRYICPQGVVPTKENCEQIDPAFYASYKHIEKALDEELKQAYFQVVDDTKKEVSALKELDPRISTLRSDVRKNLARITVLRSEALERNNRALAVYRSLHSVETELQRTTDRLAAGTELSQEEIARLVEVRLVRVKERNELSAKAKAVKAEIENAENEASALNDDIANKSVEIGKLLPTIIVNSNKLAELQTRKDLISAQLDLIPELEKRLMDTLAYPMDAWVASGTPGVEAFLERFEQAACKAGKSTVISGRRR